MKKKRFLSYLIVLICIFFVSVPAFAYSGNPYQDSHGQGYSEYQAGSRPSSEENFGTNIGTPSTGGLYNGSGGNISGSMPGSGTGGYSGGSQTNPGSGTESYSSGNSAMPGSGSGTGSSNSYPSGSGIFGGTSVTHGSTGSSGSHFGASLDSNGSITLSLPGAEGVSTGSPSSAISLIFQKYKKIAVGITGICTITAILSLLFQITKLGAAGDNERMRAIALKGIIFSGSALAIFGSLALVVGVFWNAFS